MYYISTATNMSLYISFFLILINLQEYKGILLKGRRAQDGQFPWLIQFQTIAPCGGILLSPDWVLTAAQCVQDKRNSIILFATGLNGTGSKQMVPVKATYIYPTYEAYSVLPDRDHNIALLKLTKPFVMCGNKIIVPNVVPVKYDDDYKLCLIFGWQSYVSPSSKVLAKPIQYYEDEMKACAGNPGSPVVCENQNHETAVVGIASWTNFSLECGDLPTYLDLGTFRIWMSDLVFNKDTEEWRNNSRSNEKGYTFKNSTNTHNSSWSRSNLLQLGSQISYWPEGTKVQSHNSSGTVTKYQKLSTESVNYNDTNVSSSDGYYEMSYVGVAKEPSNNIYKYKEIGSSQNNDQIIDSLNKYTQFSTINRSLLCNNKKFDEVIRRNKDQIEIDDFELLLPFNFEDITVSHSSITTVYSKKLYLFFYFLFCYLYIFIYM